jgi:adenylosuccinate synthase
MINGTRLFMMKSDILSGFRTIKACTSYIFEGKQQTDMLFDNNADIDPVYTELEGWDEDISMIREFKALPENLRNYIEFIETCTGVPIGLVSVGPDRNSTIFR